MSALTREAFKNVVMSASLIYTPLSDIISGDNLYVLSIKLGCLYSVISELFLRVVYQVNRSYDITNMLDTAGYVSLGYFVSNYGNVVRMINSALAKYIKNANLRTTVVTAITYNNNNI